jgi:hypothetical protein
VINPSDEQVDAGTAASRVRRTPIDVVTHAISEKRADGVIASEPGGGAIRILPDSVHDATQQITS